MQRNILIGAVLSFLVFGVAWMHSVLSSLKDIQRNTRHPH